jgi:hypothetical protein
MILPPGFELPSMYLAPELLDLDEVASSGDDSACSGTGPLGEGDGEILSTLRRETEERRRLRRSAG